jgi:hypothetical protein
MSRGESWGSRFSVDVVRDSHLLVNPSRGFPKCVESEFQFLNTIALPHD